MLYQHKKIQNLSEKKGAKWNFGHLPAKEADATPWYILSVDLIGHKKIRREFHDDPIILNYLTMIDPDTGCSK